MTLGVYGLGLIGASLARAARLASHRVLAANRTAATVARAVSEGVASGELTAGNVGECDFLFLAAYPGANADFLEELAPHIRPDAVVSDCGGVKRTVMDRLLPVARRYGFTFIGGHPMAGSEKSGYGNSRADLFAGAAMILTPAADTPAGKVDALSALCRELGFGSVTVTTPEEHDRVIAFTSQLAHVVSNAYIKSPEAERHKGFSAGSYRDLTRVARLNPAMWTELFLANKDNLIGEVDRLVESLGEYRAALSDGDPGRLYALLEEGSLRKERIDG